MVPCRLREPEGDSVGVVGESPGVRGASELSGDPGPLEAPSVTAGRIKSGTEGS